MLETKVLGHCGVDSGQIFITDPCYLKHTEQGNGEWTITRELDDASPVTLPLLRLI